MLQKSPFLSVHTLRKSLLPTLASWDSPTHFTLWREEQEVEPFLRYIYTIDLKNLQMYRLVWSPDPQAHCDLWSPLLLKLSKQLQCLSFLEPDPFWLLWGPGTWLHYTIVCKQRQLCKQSDDCTNPDKWPDMRQGRLETDDTSVSSLSPSTWCLRWNATSVLPGSMRYPPLISLPSLGHWKYV